jgi:UPF0042 nucleotide-binding protein
MSPATTPIVIALATVRDTDVHVESFGHLHGAPGDYDLLIDLRDFLRDPHTSPQMRQSTGRDLATRVHVLATPGAVALAGYLVGTALALLDSLGRSRPVRIGLACAGGRHRSVALAEVIAERLALAGHGVRLTHHHVSEPVVERAS